MYRRFKVNGLEVGFRLVSKPEFDVTYIFHIDCVFFMSQEMCLTLGNGEENGESPYLERACPQEHTRKAARRQYLWI